MNTYRRKVAVVGYVVVGIFFLAYIILNFIQHWFGISGLSQPIIIAFAVLIALPLVFAFVWERLTAVKVFDVEINLSEISLKPLDTPLIDALKGASIMRFDFELREPQLTSGLTLQSPLQEIVEPAIKQAGTADLIYIDLGKGDLWWSTRLYLIAALAENYFGIKHINFLEEYDGQENCFVGLATPRAISRALAVAYPPLEKSYREAYNIVANDKSHDALLVRSDRNKNTVKRKMNWLSKALPFLKVYEFEMTLQSEQRKTVVEEVTNLISSYFWQFHLQGIEENQIAKWVTKPLLKQWLGQDLTMTSVECKGIECECRHPPHALLYNIIKSPAPFVALVQNRRLIEVVNRYETAIMIAENVLKQQTPCSTVDEFD